MSQEIFSYFSQTYNLHLLESEYADIVDMVAKDQRNEIDMLYKQLNESKCKISDLKDQIERFKEALLS